MCLCGEAIYEASEACPATDDSPETGQSPPLEGVWLAILMSPTV